MSVNNWLTEVRVLDGGLGTECQRLSNLKIDYHEAWSSRLLKDDPNTVLEIHRSFIRAGSDVVSTNTYQASPSTLANALNISKTEAIDLMHVAVNLVRQAIDCEMKQPYHLKKLPILIAGSLGPYGACMADGSEYTGLYGNKISYDYLVNFHFQRAEVLLNSGVDFIAWETIPLLIEVSAMCEVMRRLSPSLCWISVASSDGETTVGGDSLQAVSSEVAKCDQVFGIGVNCNIPHHLIGKALKNLSFANPTNGGRKLLILYANDGQLWIPKSDQSREGYYTCPSDSGAGQWLTNIIPWIKRRDNLIDNNQFKALSKKSTENTPLAQWVGGCCRVGPKQIKELAQWMKHDE